MSQKSKAKLNKELYGTFENSILSRGDLTVSAYINDISKRLKSLTLKKIRQTTEAAGVSQCTRAILKSLTRKTGVTELALCQDIKYTAPTVSVALKRMAYDGLLNLVIDPNDRRQTLIYITDKGIETGKYLDYAYKEIDDILMEGLTEEEKTVLASLLEKMLKNVLAAQTDPILENIKRTPQLKMMNTKLYREMKRKEEAAKNKKQ